MSRAFKCDICGELFEYRMDVVITIFNIPPQMNCSLKFPNGEKVQFCNLGLTKSFDICPDCMNTIQSTIDGLNPSNNVDSVTIGCDRCKFGPVNTVDYMRCHKCTGYNLW